MSEVSTQPKSEVAVIFEKINTGLQAFEVRKATFTTLAEEAAIIKNAERGDKAHRKQTSEHRKKMKNARVEVEKEGKAMRDPLNIVTKQISAKQSELVDIIAPGEKDLQEIEDWYEAEDARIEREEKEREAKRIQGRVDRLAIYGYAIDITFLTGISDEQFEKVVENAKVEYEKEEAAKAEQKRLEEEEQERIRKERKELEELRAKQAEADRILKEREEEVARREKEALQKEQDERIMAERKKEKEIKDARFQPRREELLSIGFVEQGPDFSLKDTWSCYWEQVYNMSEEEWPKYIKDIMGAIERRKVRIAEEEKRQAEALEEARQRGIREAQEDAEKRAAEEAERVAQASDKEKFALIVTQLEGMRYPEMKSAKAKKLVVEVKGLTEKIVAHIKAKA